MTIDKKKAEEVAMELIHAVGGEMTDKNVIGVCKTFNYIKEMVDKNWEQYLASDSTEILAVDNIRCKCRRKIEIARTRESVYYSIV